MNYGEYFEIEGMELKSTRRVWKRKEWKLKEGMKENQNNSMNVYR